MNKELMGALDELERDKNISKETLLDAIEQSLIQAYKNHFGKADNVHVTINRETGDFSVFADRTVVEFVDDPAEEISLVEAQKQNTNAEIGDIIKVPIHSDKFGRIATQNAKNVILQKIREEERKVLFDQYHGNEKEVVTGIVQRVVGHNVSVNLGKADAILGENEQVKGETFKPTERIKVYILEVKDTPKGPRILVSRTHPGLVKRLFESEVAEVKDGTVEIKSIAREAGSRTKLAVWSNDPDVDPVGACVGVTIDDVVVDEKNYDKAEGSTIITLHPEFLSTLSVGTHTLSIDSASGSAVTEFTIEEATAEPSITETPSVTEAPSPTTAPSATTASTAATVTPTPTASPETKAPKTGSA